MQRAALQPQAPLRVDSASQANLSEIPDVAALNRYPASGRAARHLLAIAPNYRDFFFSSSGLRSMKPISMPKRIMGALRCEAKTINFGLSEG